MTKSSKSLASSPPTSAYLACALIATACIVCYAHTLSYGLTHNDDDIMVADSVGYLRNPANLPNAFLSDAWHAKARIALYRPLQTVSYMIDAQLGRDIVFASHVTNLLLHVASCLALFRLLVALGLGGRLALFGGLTYAVHYLFLHTVIWIPARGDLLLALFTFLAFLFFLRIVEGAGWWRVGAHLVCFFCALFSKETAAALPLLFLLYFLLFADGTMSRGKQAALVAGYLAVGALYVFLRASATSTAPGTVGFSAIVANLPMIPETAAKFFLPLNFSTLPAFKTSSTVAGLGILGGLAAYFLARRRRFDARATFSAGWFLLLLVPGMFYRPTFAPFTYDALDHRAYVICVGLLLLVLLAVRAAGWERHRHFWTVACIPLVILASLNLLLSRSYASPLAYAERAIATNDRSALAHFIRATSLYRQGNVEGALADFTKMLEIRPNDPKALYNRAVLLKKLRRFDEAYDDVDLLVRTSPNAIAAAYSVRGEIREMRGDYDGALGDFRTAASLDPRERQNLEIFLRRHRGASERAPGRGGAE